MHILRKAAIVLVLGCLMFAVKPNFAQAAPLGQQEQRAQLIVADGLTQDAANQYNSTLTEAGYQCAVIPSASGSGFSVVAYFGTAAQKDEARRGFLAAGYKLPPEGASKQPASLQKRQTWKPRLWQTWDWRTPHHRQRRELPARRRLFST